MKCPDCSYGTVRDLRVSRCPACVGQGVLPNPDLKQPPITCTGCGGAGSYQQMVDVSCKTCGGTATVPDTQNSEPTGDPTTRLRRTTRRPAGIVFGLLLGLAVIGILSLPKDKDVQQEPTNASEPVPEISRKSAELATPAPSNREEEKDEASTPRIFRDCPQCPEMVVVPAGSFKMGSPGPRTTPWNDYLIQNNNVPQHTVAFSKPFAISTREVSFAQWDACHAAGGCARHPDDNGYGRGDNPIYLVSWYDAKQFVAWLSRVTGQSYRLPSEAEWEYLATSVPPETRSAVGNLNSEMQYWLEDCYHETYDGAPSDGSAWITDCVSNTPEYHPVIDKLRILRGGDRGTTIMRHPFHPQLHNILSISFRVARDLAD